MSAVRGRTIDESASAAASDRRHRMVMLFHSGRSDGLQARLPTGVCAEDNGDLLVRARIAGSPSTGVCSERQRRSLVRAPNTPRVRSLGVRSHLPSSISGGCDHGNDGDGGSERAQSPMTTGGWTSAARRETLGGRWC